MKPKNMNFKSWKLLIALSLPLLNNCANTSPIKGSTDPVWPDSCTVNWLASTPMPPCAQQWLDHVTRQQCLLDGGTVKQRSQ
jgi:hypothetical protein